MNELELWQRQLRFTPNGTQTLSKMPCRYPSNYPKLLTHGKNGVVYDTQDKEYVDLIAGLGAISVGYANPQINLAILNQVNKACITSLPNKLEADVAERLTQLVPWTEMWKFGKNGTDGTVMAVRAARAYTGRTKIMTVGYNGCQEMFECRGTRTAGIPEVLKEHNTRAFYNQIDTFFDLYTKQYACVLLEPMVYEYPNEYFLKALQLACSDNGTLLIFDEVVNGGRFEGFTSASYFQVVPDLTVLGKGLGNGLPLCAVGGTRRIMETFERDDFFASGTFGADLVALSAFLATQEVLTERIQGMLTAGEIIRTAFNGAFMGLATAKGYPTRLVFEFPTDVHKYAFWQEMCKRHVLVGYTNFVMATHTVADVKKICAAIEESSKILKANWTTPELVLQGDRPTAALRK